MSQDLPNVELLRELEPVAEKLINRHMSMTKEWNPHDYVPWKEGANYYAPRTGIQIRRSSPRWHG